VTTVGQRHDSVAFEPTLATVAVARSGPGRPRTRPDAVLSDKAYSSKAIRQHLAQRGIKAVIPLKDDQQAARIKKGSAGGRPPAFDTNRYRDRNTVERAVNKLRAHRAVATRYDKRDCESWSGWSGTGWPRVGSWSSPAGRDSKRDWLLGDALAKIRPSGAGGRRLLWPTTVT
jgi:transposase